MKPYSYDELMALVVTHRRDGHTDPIPVPWHKAKRLVAEVFRCWREVAKAKGEAAVLRIDLARARKAAKPAGERATQGSLI